MNEQSHILVIDDNVDILFMIEAMLQSHGYRVTVKDNPANMEGLLKELKPDVLLMDMLLSGFDGREICRQLKESSWAVNMPVIMISAHPEAKKDCLQAGANFFLEKPFDMDVMFETLEAAIAAGKKSRD